jgi:hypothetical protein
MWLSVLALAVLGAARYHQRGDPFFRWCSFRRRTRCAARVGAVNFLFINALKPARAVRKRRSPQALLGTVPAAVLGGVGTIAIALLWMKLFPALRKVEKLE